MRLARSGRITVAARWLICNLGKDEHIQSLFYGVQECGRTATVVSLKEINEIIESPSHEPDCVITCGSIWSNSALRLSHPKWIGNWHNKPTFLCSHYYAYFGKYLAQRHYAMMPFAEVIRKQDYVYSHFGKDGKVFIRPDSGEKDFTGKVVERDTFKGWAELIGSYVEVSPDTLCVVSSPVEIQKELRLVVSHGKVVTGSTYVIAHHLLQDPLEEQDDQTEIIAFAERVLSECKSDLPPVHVIDIAVEESGMSIMEVGCFCCAGMYNCDRRKITKAISEAAERAYNESLQV